ncbi:MAG: AAA family ATPase [Candidatus Caldarchaeum sp.]
MSVFLDREKLSPAYLPKRLLHRETEKNLLMTILRPAVESPAGAGVARVKVLGGVGAGKTTLCLKVGAELESAYRQLVHVYVNLRRFAGGRVGVYRYLVRAVAEELFSQSLSAEELLDNLLIFLRNSSKRLLITFDEADYHVMQNKGKMTVFYDFTRLHEASSVRPLNVAGVVFIARDVSFERFLEKPEASSLGASVVKLEPYTKTQMRDILEDRVAEAFRKGAVSDEVLDYVADLACSPPLSGDVRYALDVLLFAGNLSESRGGRHLEIDDVRYVVAELGAGLRAEDLVSLSFEEKAVLLSVAKSLSSTRRVYAGVDDVGKAYGALRDAYGVSVEDFQACLKSLSIKGFVELRGGRQVGLTGVDARRLAEFLEKELVRRNG